jgi:hypothetical protein
MSKRSLTLAASLLILIFFSAISVSAENETFTGYLGDNLCIDSETAADGADMFSNPEDHTVMCALMKPCIKSGYAVMVKNGTGGFDVYKLDRKGNKMAVKFIESLDRTADIYVQVMGTLKGDTIQVSEIRDAL